MLQWDMGTARKGRGGKPPAGASDKSALKVKLRGKDNTPMPLAEFSEGLLDVIREFKKYENVVLTLKAQSEEGSA